MIYRVHQTVSYSEVTFDFDSAEYAIPFMRNLAMGKISYEDREYKVWLEIVNKGESDGEEEDV